jgi:sugar phosphate permease
VPASVWALGFVPLFLVAVIGASLATLGLIEGIADATATVAKAFSGALSDRIGKRKFLVGIGYGLSALTKPVFPLAGTA